MSFSQGFSSAFRSIDGGLQWRASQKQQQEQYDSTLAETQRVNDSRIDLNAADMKRIASLVSLNNQEYSQLAELHPLEVENAGLKNRRAEADTRSVQLGNRHLGQKIDEFGRTTDARVAATNDINQQEGHTARTTQKLNESMNSRDALASFSDADGRVIPGEELVKDGRAFSEAFAIAGASKHLTGGGSVPYMKEIIEDGRPTGEFYLLEESAGAGSPYQFDDDAIDENGEPRRFSSQEAAHIYNTMVGKLKQTASWGGKGPAKDEAIDQQARRSVGLGQGAPSTSQIEQEGQAIQTEIAAIQERLATLPQQAEAGASPRSMWDTINKGPGAGEGQGATYGQSVERKQLETRAEGLMAQLQELGKMSGASQLAEERGRQSTNVGRVNGAQLDSDQNRNLWQTGFAGKSPAAARKAKDDQWKDIKTATLKAASYTGADANGNPKDVALANSAGNDAYAQLRALYDGGDPYVRKLIDEGRDGEMIALVRTSMSMSGNGRLPINLSAALTTGMEGAAAEDVGRVAVAMAEADGKKLGSLSRDEVQSLQERAARVLSARQSSEPPTPDEIESLAGKALFSGAARSLGESPRGQAPTGERIPQPRGQPLPQFQ